MNNIEQKMKMTKEDYDKYVNDKAEKSHIVKNIILAFIVRWYYLLCWTSNNSTLHKFRS